MPDLTSKTTTELVADSGNGVQDWALRHANHAEADPGHGGWGRVEPAPPLPLADEQTVDEVVAEVDAGRVTAQAALDAERQGKNRTTLISQLQARGAT